MGDTATLAYQECTTFSDHDDLHVCFKALNDSHCPCNATCFWAGIGQVTLRASKTGLDSTINLYDNFIPNAFDTSIVIGSTTIILKSLSVDDFCANQGIAEKYKLVLEVKN